MNLISSAACECTAPGNKQSGPLKRLLQGPFYMKIAYIARGYETSPGFIFIKNIHFSIISLLHFGRMSGNLRAFFLTPADGYAFSSAVVERGWWKITGKQCKSRAAIKNKVC